jgi:hypothetical protein
MARLRLSEGDCALSRITPGFARGTGDVNMLTFSSPCASCAPSLKTI